MKLYNSAPPTLPAFPEDIVVIMRCAEQGEECRDETIATTTRKRAEEWIKAQEHCYFSPNYFYLVVARLKKEEDEALRLLQKAYEGFIILCNKCGSKNVAVESDVGYSPISGQWGDVSLVCQSCNTSVDIWPGR